MPSLLDLRVFSGMSNEIETRTDLRILLESNVPGEFTEELEFSAVGVMTVLIGEAFEAPNAAAEEEGGALVLPWTVASMSAVGTSPVGDITVTSLPSRPTFGTVRPRSSGSLFPALLSAEVCAALEVPGHGRLHTATPVKIGAEISSIPPFGVEAAHRSQGLLVDDQLQVRGMIIGRSITLVGPA